jgi:hypothetical protein
VPVLALIAILFKGNITWYSWNVSRFQARDVCVNRSSMASSIHIHASLLGQTIMID